MHGQSLFSFRSSIVTKPFDYDNEVNRAKIDEKGALNFMFHQIEDLLCLCFEQVARKHTRRYVQEFLQNPMTLSPVLLEIFSEDGATISKLPSAVFPAPPIAAKFLPWICDLMQEDDSKEFRVKLLDLVNHREFHHHFFSLEFASEQIKRTTTNFSFSSNYSKYFRDGGTLVCSKQCATVQKTKFTGSR